jgi:hypothetical protein
MTEDSHVPEPDPDLVPGPAFDPDPDPDLVPGPAFDPDLVLEPVPESGPDAEAGPGLDPGPEAGHDPDDIIGGLRGQPRFRSLPWSLGRGAGSYPDTDSASSSEAAPETGEDPDASAVITPLRSWLSSVSSVRPPVPPAVVLGIVGLVLLLGVVGIAYFAIHLGAPARARPSAAVMHRVRAAQSARARAELAAQIHTIVSESASTDRSLQHAVGNVRSCTRVATASAQLGRVVSRQRELLTMAATIDVRAAASGAALKASLLATLRDSLQAGREFLSWAASMKSGCRPPARSTHGYATGVRYAGAASSQRAAVDALWNPLARQESYPVETTSSW